MEISVLIGVWVAAFFTLAIFSMLYKDNIFYKLAEYIYVGVSLGYSASFYIYKTLKPQVLDKVGDKFVPDYEQYVVLAAFCAGLLLFTRFIKQIEWLSRWTMAFLIGFTAGMAIPTAIESFLLAPVSQSVKPVNNFNQLLILIGVITVLLYFFFSTEQKGALKWSAKIALVFLVIYFGSLYGATVMGRLSLLYGRFSDLVSFGDSSYFHATFVILALFIIYFIATKNKSDTTH